GSGRAPSVLPHASRRGHRGGAGGTAPEVRGADEVFGNLPPPVRSPPRRGDGLGVAGALPRPPSLLPSTIRETPFPARCSEAPPRAAAPGRPVPRLSVPLPVRPVPL